MNTPILEEISSFHQPDYDHYLTIRQDTTFVDSRAWYNVIDTNYKLPQFWTMAKENGKITGFLNLTLSTHPIFGRYLTTAPFASQGGFYFDTEQTRNALLDKASQLQTQCGAKYTVVRHLQGTYLPPEGWIQDPSYATYHIPLNVEPDNFWREHLRKKFRNQISKAKKQGFAVKFGHLELLEDFWAIISQSMKELGSPYHAKSYLETLLRELGCKATLVVVYTKAQSPAAVSLLLDHNDTVVQLHGNALRAYGDLNIGCFLDWSIVQRSCQANKQWLDMGRSLIDSNVELYKMKWRPLRKPLAYWYKLSPNTLLPNLNPANARYRLAIKLWQQMPLSLLRCVGPRLISGIL